MFGSLLPWLQQLITTGGVGGASAGELGAAAAVGGAPAVGGLMNALPMLQQGGGGLNSIPQLLAGAATSQMGNQVAPMPAAQPAPAIPTAPAMPQTPAMPAAAVTPGQIPLVQPPSAWQTALSNTATVQDMMLKQRAANRMPAAPAPSLGGGGGGKVPQLGKGGALASSGAMSPMQRFAALLRSI